MMINQEQDLSVIRRKVPHHDLEDLGLQGLLFNSRMEDPSLRMGMEMLEGIGMICTGIQGKIDLHRKARLYIVPLMI